MPFFDQLLRRPAHYFTSSFTSHRILFYVLVSTLAVAATVTNALKNQSNFYSVTIYLSKSSRSVLVLANYALILALFCGHITQRIFFGALRANEVERLYDRLWFFITESLLAFTIFRDEFDIPFALMFGFLLFVKAFHWLASDRIEWMDQRPYPGPPLLFHVRMITLFTILWLTDFVMFLFAIENTLAHGVGGMVLFASEYGILMASIMNITAKYLLSTYELRRAGQRGGESAPPWENKSMWVFYIELITDFLKLTTYLAFFSVIITFYGLPLNIIRDVYITGRSLYTRLQALHRYQIATRNMDQRYPNATEEELSTMSDRTCIICREELVVPPAADNQQAPAAATDGPNMTPKKLPCGHIFHFHCLRSWLERQQSCPTCRRTVLDNNAPPQAAAGQGGQPAAAQPAQAPQNGPQAPNGNQPRNDNYIGILQRMIGNQNQQPLAARRPPGVVPPPQVVPNVTRDAAGHVVIQYNINYQLPGPQPPNGNGNEQAPPAPLQPVQPFDGFEGPGNIWQQWPRNNAAANPETNQTPPQPTTAGPSSNSSQDPQNPQTPTPVSSTDNSTEAPTPTRMSREEAALAALRRLNSATGSSGSDTERPTTSSSSAPIPTPTPTTTNTATVTDQAHQSIDVPDLIPLYDFDAGPSTRPLNTASFIPQEPIRPGDAWGTLPPTLTDGQLSVMDKLTREAIDERLRVLERVSASVQNNIEDLMRMRSVLPPEPSSSQASSSYASNGASGSDVTV